MPTERPANPVTPTRGHLLRRLLLSSAANATVGSRGGLFTSGDKKHCYFEVYVLLYAQRYAHFALGS